MYYSGLLGAVFAVIFAFSSTLHAAIVQTDVTGTVAIGINGLVIDGTNYNVTFTAKDSFNNVFGAEDTPSTTFWGNQANAEAARMAINTELNSFDVDLVGVGVGLGESAGNFLVPFGFASTTVVSSARGANNLSGTWVTLPSPNDLFDAERVSVTNASFAQFTVVPVPAAVWLFGSGLLGLVGIARRKEEV